VKEINCLALLLLTVMPPQGSPVQRKASTTDDNLLHDRRSMCPFPPVTPGKAWLFAGSDRGAKRDACDHSTDQV
jgi:hypothetical protein